MPTTAAAATYSTYPTKADVELLFSSVGITIPATFDLGFFVYGGIDEAEGLSGHEPLIAGASATFKFDPPGPNRQGVTKGGGRRLLLDQPFATITQIKVGVTYYNATGTTLTEGIDYTLRPSNRESATRPITEVEFTSPQWGEADSIRITGTPGYGASIRAEVWNAIRSIMAGNGAHALREQLLQGIIKEKLGDETFEKTADALKSYGDTWLSDGRAVLIGMKLIY